jgi:hypothetical protein
MRERTRRGSGENTGAEKNCRNDGRRASDLGPNGRRGKKRRTHDGRGLFTPDATS